ncbi:MAG: TonB-dependent receptor, partial [Bryobacteraceae bacterium]
SRMFLAVGHQGTDITSGDLFKTLATGSVEEWPMWNAALDYTYTPRPSWLLNGRLGFMRYTQDYIPKSRGFDPATLGFPRSYTSQLVAGYFPRVDMVYFTGFGTGARTTHYMEHDYQYFATVTATYYRGRHGLRIGWEGREKLNNVWDRGNASGGFSFDGQFATGPGLTAATGFGHDLAAFLLGLPNDGSVENRSPASVRGRYYALFVQDDWRVAPTLTLNLGFRYDIESPGFEKYNRAVTGWLAGPNPIEAAAVRNYAAAPDAARPVSDFRVPGGLLYPGQQGTPSSMWDREWGRWQPRAGLAWAPDFLRRRVSFRLGGGISYFSLTPPPGFWQYGYTASTPFVASVDNGRTFLATLSNPFPGGLNQPRGSADGPLTFLGQGVTAPNRNVLPTRNNRWQASIQVQVTQNDVFEVNYTGSTQNHLPAAILLNYVPARFMGTSVTRDQAAIDFLSTPVRNPFRGLIPPDTALGGTTIRRAQLLYDYPQFTSVAHGNDNSGSITFNSVYFSWERRMHRGLSFMANYLISKQLIANSKLNPQDTRLSRTYGPEDRPQQFTLSAVWDVPVGRNRPFLNALPAVADYVLGGWQISGIFFAQSGGTIAWGPMVFLGKSWKDIVEVPGGRSIARWFNTDVFDRTPARQPVVAYQFR